MFDTTEPKDIYLDSDTYEALLNALKNLIDDAINTHAGMCSQSQVVEALGEIGNIWPVSVLEEAA